MFRTVYLIISLCVGFTFSSCQIDNSRMESLPYYNSADFTPLFLSKSEAKNAISHQIAHFEFRDQNNNLITDKSIQNKIHVANFMFTRCGSICPTMTKNMTIIQAEFGNNTNVVILSFSVTPWMDSVTQLKYYADANAITSPNWHLLTGNKDAIYTLARQSYFAEESIGLSKDSTEFLHTEHVLLVDKDKKIRGIYNGTLAFQMGQLKNDIAILLEE